MLSQAQLEAYRRMTVEERWHEVEQLMTFAWRFLKELPHEEVERRLAYDREQHDKSDQIILDYLSEVSVTELPIQQILLDVVSIIERLQIPYAVMGGMAARAWGLPRPTYDADIAVAIDAEGLQRLFDALEQDGFDIPREHRTGFLDVLGGFQKAKVNRFLDRHVWHTDLFVARGDFLHSALARARHATIGHKRVRVMAPEDIILLKLVAHRRKDLADIEEIIDVCKDLDVTYLRQWAVKLSLHDRLAEFLPE